MHFFIIGTLFIIQIVQAQVIEPETGISCYGDSIGLEYTRTERCGPLRGCGWDSEVEFSDGNQTVSDSATPAFVSHNQLIIAFNIPFHSASLISPRSEVITGKYYFAELVIYQDETVYEKHTVRCKQTGKIPDEWRY